mmetsp:Transcript_94942/g.307040  ORF Transcript_94942/g.307040 Transcript_94942/m.307040 type:complete len:261 (-) Transcript_94942:1961-2743(-)
MSLKTAGTHAASGGQSARTPWATLRGWKAFSKKWVKSIRWLLPRLPRRARATASAPAKPRALSCLPSPPPQPTASVMTTTLCLLLRHQCQKQGWVIHISVNPTFCGLARPWRPRRPKLVRPHASCRILLTMSHRLKQDPGECPSLRRSRLSSRCPDFHPSRVLCRRRSRLKRGIRSSRCLGVSAELPAASRPGQPQPQPHQRCWAQAPPPAAPHHEPRFRALPSAAKAGSPRLKPRPRPQCPWPWSTRRSRGRLKLQPAP